jgi:hypothetical protein
MTDPAGFHTADDGSEIVLDVYAESPVFRLIVTDMPAKAMGCVVANRVRSEKSFALEFVV